MSKRSIVIGILLVAGLAVAPLMGGYFEVASWDTICGPAGPTQHYSAVVDGQTSYHWLALNNAPRLTRVSNLNGAQTMSVVVSTAQWSAAGGSNTATPFYGFSLAGDYIQFSESSTDSIWRVNKTTGAVSTYVSKAAIQAFTGGTDVSLTTPSDSAPDGEFVVYDSTSKSIIKTLAGAPTTFLSSAQLISVAGDNAVGGGLTFDATGAFYWGSSTSKSIYKRAADGTLSTVLTQAQIQGVAGGTSVTFRDIYYAPDGDVYFYDGSSANILRFDPANPAGTLSNVLTKAELLAGPAASSSVYQLTWYNGNLAWNCNAMKGLYAVPEPTAFVLLALGGLCLRRRG